MKSLKDFDRFKINQTPLSIQPHLYYVANGLFYRAAFTVQGRRKVWQSGGAIINVVAIICPFAHCRYLDIYISQNIRLCNGDFEGRFQTSLQTRIMIIFIWKFISIIPIFLLFFAGVVKFTAFCTQLPLFQKGWNVWITFLHQIATWICHVIGECPKSSGFDNSCKK